MTQIKNIVLVHGAWADGSGYQGIYKHLAHRGFTVSVVQNPLTSLADDVAAVDRVLARLDGPAILVGHSYGGAVISEAGDDPKVAGLVYLAAFAPDVGENAFGMLPQDGPPPPLEPTPDGFAFLNMQAYVAAFAPDVGSDLGAFMAASQIPIAFAAGTAPLTVAAWKTKPSWYMVATDDQIIPPHVQRSMAQRAGSTVKEMKGSHVAFIAHPKAPAELIEQAARDAAR